MLPLHNLQLDDVQVALLISLLMSQALKKERVSLWAAGPAAGVPVHSALRRTNRGTSWQSCLMQEAVNTLSYCYLMTGGAQCTSRNTLKNTHTVFHNILSAVTLSTQQPKWISLTSRPTFSIWVSYTGMINEPGRIFCSPHAQKCSDLTVTQLRVQLFQLVSMSDRHLTTSV